MKYLLLFFFYASFCLSACSSDNTEPDEPVIDPPAFVSSVPADGETDVSAGTTQIVLTFDCAISLVTPHEIKLNGVAVNTPEVSGTTLRINVELQKETLYELYIPARKIKNTSGNVLTESITLTFDTEDKEEVPVKAELATANPLPEAQKVFNFLVESFGNKIISGTMANVAWNTNEAAWVYKHTGKYPALNGFDYVHLYASPANWINYENTTVIENWWKKNGLVTASWHWNVPKREGASANEVAFYTADTSFDITKALQEGTWENKVIMADLEKIAGNLLLLQKKNIPVLWRPLHEAAGKWFWWGAKGAEPCKQLWILMFDFFQSKGLNNLIWVWTSEPGDDAWYPGDAYVDIIGQDIYNKTTATQIADGYKKLQQLHPGKPLALTECGSVAGITAQWDAKACWSWFMPWYDYDRTVETTGSAFSLTTHQHADVAYWQAAFADERVLSLDEMPDFSK